jgi:hypothetical protein
MTGEHLEAILKVAGTKSDKEGWHALPEGTSASLHVAHDGAAMTISRIEALKSEGDLVYARNPKKELFIVVRSDIFAVALDGDAAAGKVVRRAGFG